MKNKKMLRGTIFALAGGLLITGATATLGATMVSAQKQTVSEELPTDAEVEERDVELSEGITESAMETEQSTETDGMEEKADWRERVNYYVEEEPDDGLPRLVIDEEPAEGDEKTHIEIEYASGDADEIENIVRELSEEEIELDLKASDSAE